MKTPYLPLGNEEKDEIRREFILVDGKLYSALNKLCVVYNDQVYYCREGRQQIRLKNKKVRLGVVRRYLVSEPLNIIPPEYTKMVPDLDLRQKYANLDDVIK